MCLFSVARLTLILSNVAPRAVSVIDESGNERLHHSSVCRHFHTSSCFTLFLLIISFKIFSFFKNRLHFLQSPDQGRMDILVTTSRNE